jgi:hypothetical protein
MNLRKGTNPEFIKDENGNLIADTQNVLNRCNSYLTR